MNDYVRWSLLCSKCKNILKIKTFRDLSLIFVNAGISPLSFIRYRMKGRRREEGKKAGGRRERQGKQKDKGQQERWREKERKGGGREGRWRGREGQRKRGERERRTEEDGERERRTEEDRGRLIPSTDSLPRWQTGLELLPILPHWWQQPKALGHVLLLSPRPLAGR